MKEHGVAMGKLTNRLEVERAQRKLVREQLGNINQQLKTIVNGTADRDTEITNLLGSLTTQHSCSTTEILGEVYKMREAISASLKTDGNVRLPAAQFLNSAAPPRYP